MKTRQVDIQKLSNLIYQEGADLFGVGDLLSVHEFMISHH
jgi:hypothetical protein